MKKNELAHWGIKGMRWGHRKKIDDTDRSSEHPSDEEVSAMAARANEMHRNRRLHRAMTAGIGGIAIGALLAKHGKSASSKTLAIISAFGGATLTTVSGLIAMGKDTVNTMVYAEEK